MTQGFPAQALCVITDTKPLMIHCQLSSQKAGAPAVRMQEWNFVHKLCGYLGGASINNCGSARKRRSISLHHCNHYGNHSLRERIILASEKKVHLSLQPQFHLQWLQLVTVRSVRPKCVLKDLPQNLLFRSWHCPPPCVMASRRHLWLAHLIACNLLQHWAPQFLHNGSNWMKENIKEKFMRVVGFFKQDFWLDSFKVFNIRKDQLSSMTQNASQASISSCAAA